MKKFFEYRNAEMVSPDISKITKYRKLLLMEMKKMGTSESDLNLVCGTIIINAINNDRKAEDVAWAILQ